jgi:acyl carrier protein
LNTKINSLVSEILHIPLEKVTDDLSMAKVESWDSLQHMNLVASIETAFAVEFTFEEIVVMQTVGEIKRILHEKGVSD